MQVISSPPNALPATAENHPVVRIRQILESLSGGPAQMTLDGSGLEFRYIPELQKWALFNSEVFVTFPGILLAEEGIVKASETSGHGYALFMAGLKNYPWCTFKPVKVKISRKGKR